MPRSVSAACSQAISRAVAGCSQPREGDRVHVGQDAPGGGGGGDRSEHLVLVAQQSQVGDGLAAVGEHHGQIDRNPARIVLRSPRPQLAKCAGEGAGQAGGIGEINQ